MRKFPYILTLFLWALSMVPGLSVTMAQSRTGISGMVVDRETGETLPMAQIYFIRSSSRDALSTGVGTTSDLDGNFIISTTEPYTTLCFQMVGYKTEMLTLRAGQIRQNAVIKLTPDVYGLQDIVVTPKHRKQQYRRKGNPAVDLIRNVIAHKDSATVRTAPQYTEEVYQRMSFAIDNFTPNYDKGLWKSFRFVRNYVDTTGVYPALTVSIRERVEDRYYVRKPYREKKILRHKRIFGLESVFTSETLQQNLEAIFKDIDINNDNIEILFNRFVSPLSSSLAVSYYQYYIIDTVLVDGQSCIDLAFVPVNSESYSFTGHLYVLNDSTYKIKKYTLSIPTHINLNFVSDFASEHRYRQLENGLWADDRTTTYAKFYIANRKKNLWARQTSIHTEFDLDRPIDKKLFSPMIAYDAIVLDTTSVREDLMKWDSIRPEPLSQYETGVVDLIEDFKRTPKFNSLIMAVDALTTEFVATVPSTRWGESKWDFGPIYNTISWNMLEGVRLRIGGTTTANVSPHFFVSTYLAFGTTDLRPKGNLTLMYSFNRKKYHQYEPLRHYISLSAQYDVDEPGQQFGVVERDNILMSIPTGKIVMKNYAYQLRARLQYMKEWNNHLTLKTNFDFENNEAAGAMNYDRIVAYTDGYISETERIRDFRSYELCAELRYIPGSALPINRYGVESPFTIEQDAPMISFSHRVGYLDDRYSGGKGYVYNISQLTAEKRFWFSSFGHLDARLQTGIVWQKVPFMRLYSPTTSTSIFLGKSAFNLMQPTEFMMDQYVSWYMTYFFKGWILNRIPGINRLKLRGVVSFSGIWGNLSAKNNPYLDSNAGLYALPNSAVYSTATDASLPAGDDRLAAQGEYLSGYTSSPIDTRLPYMELTAGFENILKFVRIDYVRRLTYNEYTLPDGHVRRIGAWGRNGVKISVRFAL